MTYADSQALERDYDFRPVVDIQQGLNSFAAWYKEFYNC
ncbi:hypothetical protein SELR_17100 [Selenomonas ruminantium subsp. lactilytica TAM6421]|uniref:UDP-glucuronate 4-epimerase n=1 Tax=Selenomonas ruminantium subsp. lactilytica (strain NBRC 103574 / TAM6421) TaxID=927704 RepID=I0GRN1_SELRL|nr:hypothetical protein SELR_17100 [Selenomonas ruminantium subsp. lactilytica TAM6421]